MVMKRTGTVRALQSVTVGDQSSLYLGSTGEASASTLPFLKTEASNPRLTRQALRRPNERTRERGPGGR